MKSVLITLCMIAGGLWLFPTGAPPAAIVATARPVAAAPQAPAAAPAGIAAIPTGAAESNPIAVGGDACGWNVQVALDARGGALRSVTLAPGETFSFNATMGDPGAIPYQTCAGVPGGNWCNLAARYAQAARAIGLVPRFHDHGVGDLGGGPENSVAIWNIGGQAGSVGGAQDLEITNTTGRIVTFRARDLGGAVAIVASVA